jgi:hypothetical protein
MEPISALSPSCPLRIALVGKIASGKTSLRAALRDELEKHGAKVLCVSLGDRLKEIVHELYPPTEKGNKPRNQLCDFAKAARDIDPDVWVNAMFRTIEAAEGTPIILVDDVRQHNEYARMKDAGFVFIRLNIDDETQRQRIRYKYGAKEYGMHMSYTRHETERQAIEYDTDHYHMDLDGTWDMSRLVWLIMHALFLNREKHNDHGMGKKS